MIEGKLVALELHNGFGAYASALILAVWPLWVSDPGIGEDSGDRGRWTVVQPGSSITVDESAACGLGGEGRGPNKDHHTANKIASFVQTTPAFSPR